MKRGMIGLALLVVTTTLSLLGGPGKAIGSVCLRAGDQTAIAMRAARRGAISLGATENRRDCKSPSVAGPERRGTPQADRSYSAGCYRLLPGNLRIVRYPDDFSAAKPSRCRAQKPSR